MARIWTDSTKASYRDAYLDWIETQNRPSAEHAQARYEPVFVRLTDATARGQLLALVEDPSSALIMDGSEYAELAARSGPTDPFPNLPDEYALYRREGTPDEEHSSLFEVLDTGVPVRITDTGAPLQPLQPAPATAKSGAPIIAVIDDGIAFLNSRFVRTGPTGQSESRIHALWLQSLEQRAEGRAVCGKVLARDEITAMLDGNEAEHYTDINTQMFGRTARHSTAFGTSHGTHMLDVAAGADPLDSSDSARDWPILAVQLPPQAIEDTSGTRFESYMVQGVRWILRRAYEVDPSAPVIINLSLGIFAGPKDGTRFIEYQIAREAAAWEMATKQRVRIVWSFGNAYQSKLIARQPLAAKGPKAELTWRVQPCDQTSSYMEIRVPAGAARDLELALTSPDGDASGFQTLASGQIRTLEQEDQPIARIYHVPARDFGTGVVSSSYYVLALAPTESLVNGDALAPAGAWTVALRNLGTDSLDVVSQIQRDDSLRGYQAQARQSYFDDTDAYVYAQDTRDYRGYASKCPITHEGTHSAMVTSDARQVLCVGAAQTDASSSPPTPAPYTSAGADWSVLGPTVSTVVHSASSRRGTAASGTLTGSKRVIGGTSAAAAHCVRALGLSAARIVSQGSQGHVSMDFDEAQLTLAPVADADRARLGDFVVIVKDSQDKHTTAAAIT